MSHPLIREALDAFYDSPTLAHGYASALREATSYYLDGDAARFLIECIASIRLANLADLRHPPGYIELRYPDSPWITGDVPGPAIRRRMRSLLFARVHPEAEEREMGVGAAYVFHERHEVIFAQHIRPADVYLTGALLLHAAGELSFLEYPHVPRSHPDFALTFDILQKRDAARVCIDQHHRADVFRQCIGVLVAREAAPAAFRGIDDPYRPPTRQQQRTEGYVVRPHYSLDLDRHSRLRIQDAARALGTPGDIHFDVDAPVPQAGHA